MSEPSPAATNGDAAGRPKFHRRQYIVDARTQFRVAGLMVAGLGVLAMIQAAALLTAFVPPAEALFEGQQVRQLLLKVCMLQFGVTAVMMLALGILLSHRFVGAALVLRRAIQGMRTGDIACRLTLRKTDFLHDVASDLAELRHEQARRDAVVAGALADLERCAVEGNLAGTRAAATLARRALGAPDATPEVARVPAEPGASRVGAIV